MLETYEKIAHAKRNTAEYKRNKALEEEWLKYNRPTICNTAQNYQIPKDQPDVLDDFQ